MVEGGRREKKGLHEEEEKSQVVPQCFQHCRIYSHVKKRGRRGQVEASMLDIKEKHNSCLYEWEVGALTSGQTQRDLWDIFREAWPLNIPSQINSCGEREVCEGKCESGEDVLDGKCYRQRHTTNKTKPTQYMDRPKKRSLYLLANNS